MEKSNNELLDELVSAAIKDNLIDVKDTDVMRVCFAPMIIGAEKSDVRKLVGDIPRFDEYWKNLSESGYFKNGCVMLDYDKEIDSVTLGLMVNVAYGYIKRVKVEK